jgi:TolB protein
MKRGFRYVGVLVMAAAVFGCDPIDPGGGGGGGGTVNFTKGYAFIRRDDRNVYVADNADLATVARLTTSGACKQPSISKDGKQVVFVCTSGTDTQILTTPANGSTAAPSVVRTSSATEKNFRTPVFSPDGTQIAFTYDSGSSSYLGIVNTDGSGFSKLAGTGTLSYASPSFYPDGLSVLAMAGSSSATYDQLEKVTVATGATVNVASDLGNEATAIVNRAVVSGDGSKAAFDGRIASGASRIFVIDLSSKAVNQLTDYPSDPQSNDSFPVWVGADKVGFSSDVGGSDQVYALPSISNKTSGGIQFANGIEPWYGPN